MSAGHLLGRKLAAEGEGLSNTVTLPRADFVLLHGFLVFFMQVGFLSLECGAVRAKNVRNILLKNTVDVLLSALAWWFVGYAFAYGDSAGGFIGSTSFFCESNDAESKPWFFSWTFAVSSVTIVGGSLAERTNLLVYPLYTTLMAAWVHPLVVHWTWNRGSWLHNVSGCNFLDFAGGTVVHLIGGLMGLVGAVMCGPRLGRFEDGDAKAIPGHDVSSVAMGTFFLWFGWYGFNCGSIYMYTTPVAAVTDRVALNMTLSACTSGLTALLIASLRGGSFDLVTCCNGVLSGLVAATATCAYVAPWAAVVIGIVAGAVYLGSSKLLLKLSIDDPLDSSAIHFVSGLLGTLLLALFARPQYVELLSGTSCGGIVYTSSGWTQLGMQLLGVTVASAWTAFFSAPLFWLLSRLGRLRVDQTTELAGIDNIEHGGPAYPEFNLVPMNHGNAN